MSRRVVGYEGEGKHRRPVYDSPPAEELAFNPPGAIERRQAADHEREGFAPGRVSPGLSRAAPRHLTEASLARPAVVSRQNPDQLHASRMRGAVRHLEVVAARAEPRRSIAVLPSPVTPEEEPAMAIAAVPPPDIIDVELIVPCGNCAHELVCSIRPTLTRGLVQIVAGPLHEALTVAAPNVVIECEHFLDRTGVIFNREAARQTLRKVDDEDARAILDRVAGAIAEPVDDAPQVVTRRPEPPAEPAGEPGRTAAETRRAAAAAGGGPGPTIGRQQQQILAATIAHSGDRRAVSAELGLGINHIETQLEYIGKKGLLPIDLIAKLPARFAKYTPAGG